MSDAKGGARMAAPIGRDADASEYRKLAADITEPSTGIAARSSTRWWNWSAPTSRSAAVRISAAASSLAPRSSGPCTKAARDEHHRHPRPVGDLTHAEGSYRTPYGVVSARYPPQRRLGKAHVHHALSAARHP